MTAGPNWRWAIWAVAAVVAAWACIAAAQSPLLAWRSGVYVVAGFAGIVGLALAWVQMILVLFGAPVGSSRRIHRISGVALVVAVVLHAALLWITSPPDVIDALTFMAPSWFSVWGVIAMWAVFVMAIVAMVRRRFLRRQWPRIHRILGYVVGAGGIAHAMLIDGAMGDVSKGVLSVCVAVTMFALWRSKVRWGVIPSRRDRRTGQPSR